MSYLNDWMDGKIDDMQMMRLLHKENKTTKKLIKKNKRYDEQLCASHSSEEYDEQLCASHSSDNMYCPQVSTLRQSSLSYIMELVSGIVRLFASLIFLAFLLLFFGVLFF